MADMAERLLLEVLCLRFYQYQGTELEPVEFRAFAESKHPQEHYEVVFQSANSLDATPLGMLIPADGSEPMRIVRPVYDTWPGAGEDLMLTTWFEVNSETGEVTCHNLEANDAADLYSLNKRVQLSGDASAEAAAKAVRDRATAFCVRIDCDTHNCLGLPQHLRSVMAPSAA